MNDPLDFSNPVTLSSNEFFSPTSTKNIPSTISTERTILLQNSTHSFNNISSSPSTDNEYNKFDYREPTPPHEQINEITDMSLNNNSTKTSFLQDDTKLIVDWFNQTHVLRKTLKNNKQNDTYNTTLKEVAKYLSDRKSMQSLIHLLPPHLWSQIQNNRSIIQQNQTQYAKPFLPNPVLLAEAAAQAGLPGPGPYPIPDHLWHRNPPYAINRSPITCTFIGKKN